jgi:signal peptidase I
MSDTSKLMKNIFVDTVEILVISIAIFALAWIFLAEPLEVTGDSMLPTLHTKEQVVAEKVSMNFGDLERQNIVVFHSPENPKILVIKRIIGLPGDVFSIIDGQVYINESKLDEDYLAEGTKTIGKDAIGNNQIISIPEGKFLALGDNRTNSTDSRDFGLVSKDALVGKAVVVYYPIENFRLIGKTN